MAQRKGSYITTWSSCVGLWFWNKENETNKCVVAWIAARIQLFHVYNSCTKNKMLACKYTNSNACRVVFWKCNPLIKWIRVLKQNASQLVGCFIWKPSTQQDAAQRHMVKKILVLSNLKRCKENEGSNLLSNVMQQYEYQRFSSFNDIKHHVKSTEFLEFRHGLFSPCALYHLGEGKLMTPLAQVDRAPLDGPWLHLRLPYWLDWFGPFSSNARKALSALGIHMKTHLRPFTQSALVQTFLPTLIFCQLFTITITPPPPFF